MSTKGGRRSTFSLRSKSSQAVSQEVDSDDECAEFGPSQQADEEYTKTGTMTKQGGLRKNWKKRWFALSISQLAYFSNNKRLFKGAIALEHISEIRSSSMEEAGKQHGIVIETPGRTWKLICDTVAEVDDWMFAIKAGMKARDIIISSGGTIPSAKPPPPKRGISSAGSVKEKGKSKDSGSQRRNTLATATPTKIAPTKPLPPTLRVAAHTPSAAPLNAAPLRPAPTKPAPTKPPSGDKNKDPETPSVEESGKSEELQASSEFEDEPLYENAGLNIAEEQSFEDEPLYENAFDNDADEIETRRRSSTVSSVCGERIEHAELPEVPFYVTARYGFDAEDETEVGFGEGDRLIIHNADHEEWWVAELNGRTGHIPADRVDVLYHDDEEFDEAEEEGEGGEKEEILEPDQVDDQDEQIDDFAEVDDRSKLNTENSERDEEDGNEDDDDADASLNTSQPQARPSQSYIEVVPMVKDDVSDDNDAHSDHSNGDSASDGADGAAVDEHVDGSAKQSHYSDAEDRSKQAPECNGDTELPEISEERKKNAKESFMSKFGKAAKEVEHAVAEEYS